MKEEKKLKVTNYDNFKNASFFKKQYFQAQDMLKEVNDFYNSFCMSKLLTAADLKNVKPVMIGKCIWTYNFILPFGYSQAVDAVIKKKDYKRYMFPDGEKKDTKALVNMSKEYALQSIRDLNAIIEEDPQYDCYYVLDQYNIVQEFIPVKCKDTIKIDFSGENIEISGHYFEYNERGARFGQAAHSVVKIIKKVIINQDNNNVIDVETCSETVETGNAGGKSYYDEHINYEMTDRTLDAICTHKWNGIRARVVRSYRDDRQRRRHSLYFYPNEPDIEDILVCRYGEMFKEQFKRPLTRDLVERWTRWW